MGTRVKRGQVATAAVVLVAGVTAGLVVGGSVDLGGHGARAASRPASPSSSSAPSSSSSPSAGPAAGLPQGSAAVSNGATPGDAPPSPPAPRTTDGAAAAFTADAAWLIGSTAAAADPDAAVQAVAGTALNPADARLLTTMHRASGDGLRAEQGAYRVLGYAGDPASPTEVMVEVTAPLTVAGRTRWAKVGGVVTWVDGAWRLTSIRPSEVPQPPAARRDVRAFSAGDRARTLRGQGWRTFAGRGR